jgi:hypothetical protein
MTIEEECPKFPVTKFDANPRSNIQIEGVQITLCKLLGDFKWAKSSLYIRTKIQFSTKDN